MASKYTGLIALDLSRKGEVRLPCNRFNRIWLPKFVLVGGVIVTNPTDCVVQVRFNESGSDGELWAIADAYRNVESVDAMQVLYKVITRGINPILYLQTGDGVVGGYGSTDGLSPFIGGGAVGDRNRVL